MTKFNRCQVAEATKGSELRQGSTQSAGEEQQQLRASRVPTRLFRRRDAALGDSQSQPPTELQPRRPNSSAGPSLPMKNLLQREELQSVHTGWAVTAVFTLLGLVWQDCRCSPRPSKQARVVRGIHPTPAQVCGCLCPVGLPPPLGQLSHCRSNHASFFLVGGCMPSTGLPPLRTSSTQLTSALLPPHSEEDPRQTMGSSGSASYRCCHPILSTGKGPTQLSKLRLSSSSQEASPTSALVSSR